MNTNKRKEIEKLVYDFLTIVDSNSNFVNRDFYEGLFASMDEKEFNEWVKDIGNTPEDTISVYQMPWKSVSLAQLEKSIGVPKCSDWRICVLSSSSRWCRYQN